MLFTWMVAAQMWMESAPAADLFRMAEEETAKLLNLLVGKGKHAAVPNDKKLVA